MNVRPAVPHMSALEMLRQKNLELTSSRVKKKKKTKIVTTTTTTAIQTLDMVVHTRHSNIQEAETGGSEVQGHSQLLSWRPVGIHEAMSQ